MLTQSALFTLSIHSSHLCLRMTVFLPYRTSNSTYRKQFLQAFLVLFQARLKAPDATRDIDDVFESRIIIESTSHCWSKRFHSGEEGFEDHGHTGQPSHVDNDHLRSLENDIRHITIRRLCENLMAMTLTIYSLLKNIESSRRPNKRFPHKLFEIKKS